jgi:hypothetical protein
VTDAELASLLLDDYNPALQGVRVDANAGLPTFRDCRGDLIDHALPLPSKEQGGDVAHVTLRREQVGRDARGDYAIVSVTVGAAGGLCEGWAMFLAIVRLGDSVLRATGTMAWDQILCSPAPPPTLVQLGDRDVLIVPTAAGNGESDAVVNSWVAFRIEDGKLVSAGGMRRTIDTGNVAYEIDGWTATMNARIAHVGTSSGIGIEVEESWSFELGAATRTKTLTREYRFDGKTLAPTVTADPKPGP